MCDVHMYVCMYACMHVSMCVCMYVGLYACMYVGLYVCRLVCMYVCMYACMVAGDITSSDHHSLTRKLSLLLKVLQRKAR